MNTDVAAQNITKQITTIIGIVAAWFRWFVTGMFAMTQVVTDCVKLDLLMIKEDRFFIL